MNANAKNNMGMRVADRNAVYSVNVEATVKAFRRDFLLNYCEGVTDQWEGSCPLHQPTLHPVLPVLVTKLLNTIEVTVQPISSAQRLPDFHEPPQNRKTCSSSKIVIFVDLLQQNWSKSPKRETWNGTIFVFCNNFRLDSNECILCYRNGHILSDKEMASAHI